MEATRPLAHRARHRRFIGRIPPLFLLRSAVGLVILLTLAAGASTPDPNDVTTAVNAPTRTASPGGRSKDSGPSARLTKRKRNVFVCDEAGTPVFSDRPCGPDLLRRSIEVRESLAGQAASTLPPVAKASTRPRIRNPDFGNAADDAARRCTALRRQLEELDDRMRTGYSSREAARLWERRRAIKDDLRTGDC